MEKNEMIAQWLRKNWLALVFFALSITISITYTTYSSQRSKDFQISLANAQLRAQEYIQRGGELPQLFCNPSNGVSLQYSVSVGATLHLGTSLEVTVTRANGTIEKLSGS